MSASQSLTVVGPNLPQQAKAEFHVHATGCADLQRGWIKRYAAEAWDMEATCLLDVEADVYDFAPAESEGYVLGDYLDQFHFAPCVTLPRDAASVSPNALAEYLTDTPRSGRVVELYLDGRKDAAFDRLIGPRWIGRSGLLVREGRKLCLDAADLDELHDAAVEAHGELVDEQGGPKMAGPQVSAVAIVQQIRRALDSEERAAAGDVKVVPDPARGRQPKGEATMSSNETIDTTTEVPEAPQASADRNERVKLAREEDKAVKAWTKAGGEGERPATPNLDAITAEANNGSSSKARSSRAASAAKPTPQRPKAERNETVLDLRNDKHGEVLARFVKGTKVRVVGPFAVVPNGEAQQVFDKLAAADTSGQFDARLVLLGQLLVRKAFPKVTDQRGSLIARCIDKLHETGASWEPRSKPDATPLFVVDGTEYPTLRALASHLGIATKAPAKKAASKAPAKKASASKRTSSPRKGSSSKSTAKKGGNSRSAA